jgi:hypothetical protein
MANFLQHLVTYIPVDNRYGSRPYKYRPPLLTAHLLRHAPYNILFSEKCGTAGTTY